MSAAARAVTRPGALACTLALIAGLLGVAVTVLRPRPAAAAPGGDPIAYAVTWVGFTQSTSTVHAIDTVTQKQVGSVVVGGVAGGIAITPDAKLALVPAGPFALTAAFRPPGALASGGTLNAISTATNKVVASAPIGANPVDIAVGPDGTAYVVDGFDSATTGGITPVTVGAGPTLTEQPTINLPTSAAPTLDAVTPDGKTLLVLGQDSVLYAFNLPAGTLAGQVSVPSGDSQFGPSLVVSPDGSTAYLTSIGAAGGDIAPIALKPTLALGTPIALPPNAQPSQLAIGTTPAGTSTLFATDAAANSLYSIPLANPTTVKTLALSVSPHGLFVTPDGATVEITTTGDETVSVTGAGSPPGTLGPCLLAQSCPPGMNQIAITPDQAPAAEFASTPGPPGKPSTFDASPSTVAYGSITTYDWDFGDGSPHQSGASPTASHTYSQSGQYSVVLTETDSAGTTVSTSPPSTIFTGKTMSRQGSTSARVTHRITVSTSIIPTSTASATPTTTASPLPSPPPGFSPKITLSPAVGPPGTVVAVDGTGFPASSAVALVWSPGIGRTTVTTDAHGTFTGRQVLIFPKDRLGPRTLTADPFPTATAAFLVVPPPLAPGGVEQILPQLVYRG
ncbi:MAG TPA: PKD domain-containing protein [Actinomycetota bacterium]|nr:PKD domain-containing protein [Actinomycetota bacterium]